MNPLSRREFLKVAGIGLGAAVLKPWERLTYLADFPQAERLGRLTEGVANVRMRPDIDSPQVSTLYEDAIVPWLRETIGPIPRVNQRWVETPDGYVWAPLLQPVLNQPNEPVLTLPETSLGPGMWVEVTVPYVDMDLENPPPRTVGFQKRAERGLPPRLFYSEILWVDRINTDNNGQVWYRVNERYGPGELLWGPAEAFRPMAETEISPLSPEVEDKLIEVNLSRQTISCFEGGNEVYFARASTGKESPPDAVPEDVTDTPVSDWHYIWRKMVSTHMAGGTNIAGWDLPGIGFATYFVGSGVAFHSTYWHNNFGEKTSRGCVNLAPHDARFVFRWTSPQVTYDPGDMTVSGQGGTRIKVVEL